MIFSAEITDLKIMYNVLKSLLFREFVILRPMEEGLKFTLEEMNCVEISVYVPADMFLEYKIKKNIDLIFKISLKIFTDCLNIFGDETNSHLKLSYEKEGAPLSLIIKHSEEDVMIDCQIKSLEVCDNNISLASECNFNKIILNADIFTEILQRLDNSADTLQIILEIDRPYFTLVSTGISGESRINISKHADFVTVLECTKSVCTKYLFSYIRQIVKVMSYANKVALSTGDEGLMGLQLIINPEKSQSMFVEYFFTAQVDED